MKFFSALALLLASKCVAKKGGTEVTNETFALAETQGMFDSFLFKLKKTYPETSGTGRFIHARNVTGQRDKDIPRPNFDTLYSVALLDLTEPCKLTIGNTGRYQSVLIVTEHHWMPTFFINTSPGTFKLTKDDLGDRHVVAMARTLLNKDDPADVLEAYALQNSLQISQDNKGKYEPEEEWDEESLEERRLFFIDLGAKKVVKSGEMFGPNDGTINKENHNIGVATGWGGNPPERAVYENYMASSSGPYTLKLKNVPVKGFWSVTLYDYLGFVDPMNTFHINSGFAEENDDGSVTINFVDDRGDNKVSDSMLNVMGTYPGWNFVLRLYEPEDKIINGNWDRPELVFHTCPVDYSKTKCEFRGCMFAKNEEGEKECGHWPSDAKKLCGTYLSQETCNAPEKEGVCLWDSAKKRCDVFKCKYAKTEEDCLEDYCTWSTKKESCKDGAKLSAFVLNNDIGIASEVKGIK